ncbi:DUF1349 domain-containing protein, partial [Rhizobium ruizarguesonis]
MPGADTRTPEKYTIFGCARLHHGRALCQGEAIALSQASREWEKRMSIDFNDGKWLNEPAQ